MRIDQDDYTTYFYEKASDDYSDYVLGVKYDNPVRLSGKVQKIKNTFSDSSDKKIKVFDFVEADAGITLTGSTYSISGNVYTANTLADRFVYADIAHIQASSYTSLVPIGISSFTTAVVLQCTTASGETIDMLIPPSDYQTYFDQNANFQGYSSFEDSTPDDLDFAHPVRIGGFAVNAEDEFSSTTYDGKIIFEFMFTVAEDVTKALIQNQPAIAFSDNLPPKQQVYVTLKSLTPIYSITNALDVFSNGLMCKGETSDGNEVWIYMTYNTFKNDFVNTFVESDWTNIRVDLEDVTVYGRIHHADDLANDLEDKIGTQKVIFFEKRS